MYAFNTTVNFDASSNQITDFDLSVSGSGGYAASISNATGAFSSSHFSISTGTGTWTLTPPGGTPSDCAAYGSLYGPNGEYMGGAWGMKYSVNSVTEGAAGIFQGKK